VTRVTTGNAPEARRKRLLYRATHRGTREADVLIGAFAEACLGELDPSDLDQFEALLEVPDADLYNWITGREPSPPTHDGDVFRRLTAFRPDSDVRRHQTGS